MGRDHELGAVVQKSLHVGQKHQLPLRRQSGFRLVEEKEPVGPEPMFDEGEKRLPVALMMKGEAAVVVRGLHFIDVTRDVKETLGPEKKRIPGRAGTAHEQ